MARKAVFKHGEFSLGKLKSRKQWCVQWHEGGKRPRHNLNLGLDRPQREAEAALILWVRGKEAAKNQDAKVTVSNVMDAYIEEKRKEGKNTKTMGYNWKALKPFFAHLQPIDLTAIRVVEGEERTVCHEYAVARANSGIARDTIWTELNRLRTACNWAAATNLIKGEWKAKNVWVPSQGPARDIFLEEDEVFRVFDECRMPHVRLTLILALCTGARKTAIRELRWTKVDFEKRQIDYRTTGKQSILDSSHKKGRAIVDMNNLVHAALREAFEWKRRTSDYVIEYKGRSAGDTKKAIARAIARAGLGGRRIGLHTLRHTLATWAASKEGMDMRVVQRMLGHDQMKTTDKIYAKHRRGYTRSAVDVADLGPVRPIKGQRNAA
jgi:integrase